MTCKLGTTPFWKDLFLSDWNYCQFPFLMKRKKKTLKWLHRNQIAFPNPFAMRCVCACIHSLSSPLSLITHPKTVGLKTWLSHRCPFRHNYIKRGQVSVCSLSSVCGLPKVTKIKDHPKSWRNQSDSACTAPRGAETRLKIQPGRWRLCGVLDRSLPGVLNGVLIYWAQFGYADKGAEEKDPNTQRERDRGRDWDTEAEKTKVVPSLPQWD